MTTHLDQIAIAASICCVLLTTHNHAINLLLVCTKRRVKEYRNVRDAGGHLENYHSGGVEVRARRGRQTLV